MRRSSAATPEVVADGSLAWKVAVSARLRATSSEPSLTSGRRGAEATRTPEPGEQNSAASATNCVLNWGGYGDVSLMPTITSPAFVPAAPVANWRTWKASLDPAGTGNVPVLVQLDSAGPAIAHR